jgi:hypothetical protein
MTFIFDFRQLWWYARCMAGNEVAQISSVVDGRNRLAKARRLSALLVSLTLYRTDAEAIMKEKLFVEGCFVLQL